MSNFATVWTSHIKDKQDKDRFLETLSLSMGGPDWKRFVQILEDKLSAEQKQRYKGYDEPSWAFHQAHLNGYRQAIQEVMQLIPTTVNNGPKK